MGGKEGETSRAMAFRLVVSFYANLPYAVIIDDGYHEMIGVPQEAWQARCRLMEAMVLHRLVDVGCTQLLDESTI